MYKRYYEAGRLMPSLTYRDGPTSEIHQIHQSLSIQYAHIMYKICIMK